ncbi:Olfactory receptor 5L1 [Lemmus lemmus]
MAIYTVTLVGNIGIIVVRRINPKLHTPMYFFLSHLSFLDICYSSVFTPKLLEILVVEQRTISLKGCMVQFFFGCACVITEMFMLAVMAYDRFVAVCNPLLYTVAMSRQLCALLVAGICSLIHLCLALDIPSFKSNVINHFFCDLPPLLSLACSDVTKNELFLFIIVNFNEILTIVIIFISYLLILVTILKMRSAEGRRKAFSTCASHLTVIIVFHGTILFIYCQPSSGNSVDVDKSMDIDKMTSVFYTLIIPMLNPLIYSLRNKDVKIAFRKIIDKKLLS